MIDYRVLSKSEKSKVDKSIIDELEGKSTQFKVNGTFTTMKLRDWYSYNIHEGNYCAECFCVYYNCLCSHDD